jgi:hypothetical protein
MLEPNSPLSLTFGSQVDIFGRAGFLAPAAVIQISHNKFLHVALAIPDERLGIELKRLHAILVKRKFTRPQVTFEFDSQFTCADLISSQPSRRRGKTRQVIPGYFRIRFSSKNRDIVSSLLGGQLMVLATSEHGKHLFACHSHWRFSFSTPGVFGPFTSCHDTGPCPAPERCLCFDPIGGAALATCQGWQFCFCV